MPPGGRIHAETGERIRWMAIRDFDEVNLKIGNATAAVAEDFDEERVVVSTSGLGTEQEVTVRVELETSVAMELGEVIARDGKELHGSS